MIHKGSCCNSDAVVLAGSCSCLHRRCPSSGVSDVGATSCCPSGSATLSASAAATCVCAAQLDLHGLWLTFCPFAMQVVLAGRPASSISAGLQGSHGGELSMPQERSCSQASHHQHVRLLASCVAPLVSTQDPSAALKAAFWQCLCTLSGIKLNSGRTAGARAVPWYVDRHGCPPHPGLLALAAH